jgi:molybdate transport system ATP-binding protein
VTIEFRASLRLGAFHYSAEFAATNEIVVLFGHSGAGKSVTLQLVAGLMCPDEGRISVEGVTVFDSTLGIDQRPQNRGVGYVVQELALFDNMTVAENIAFGVPRGVSPDERVAELVAQLGLTGMEKRRPRTLSGGQRQRVALARALGRDARVLLLDEPFSALDDSLRSGLRRELLRLRSELGLTILFVTHDLREAHLLADKLAVFDEGQLLQFGLRDDVFRRPASRRVAELTGVSNIWPGRVVARDEGGVRVDVSGVELRCSATGLDGVAAGQGVEVVVRAERVNLRRDVNLRAPERNLVPATLVEESAYGNVHVLRFDPDGAGPSIEVEIGARPYEVLGVGRRRQFVLELEPAELHVIPIPDG